MSEDPRACAAAERIVGEVRAVRDQLHDLVARLHSERTLWERYASGLQQRPRLTASQRRRLRRRQSR